MKQFFYLVSVQNVISLFEINLMPRFMFATLPLLDANGTNFVLGWIYSHPLINSHANILQYQTVIKLLCLFYVTLRLILLRTWLLNLGVKKNPTQTTLWCFPSCSLIAFQLMQKCPSTTIGDRCRKFTERLLRAEMHIVCQAGVSFPLR